VCASRSRFSRRGETLGVAMHVHPPDLVEALALWTAAPGRESAAGFLEAAEQALVVGEGSAETWGAWLDTTGRSAFLRSLPDAPARERWAEMAFRAIRLSGYSLRRMLADRAAEHPERILFEDRRELDAPRWTYAEIRRYARSIAGVLLDASPSPRVAIVCDNNVDAAAADLACLTEGILVTPLNVNFDLETLARIFERLQINVAITDTDERQAMLAEIRARSGRELIVFRTGSRTGGRIIEGLDSTPLRQACAQVDLSTLEARLDSRPVDLFAPATVMFTSGSTGEAKGVVFSQYMLLTKRLARAAALPEVGDGEVLLCYLPLFHTFGRYLEMLGSVFWRGTYVFAGNPSAEALIAELGRVRPTGLISVPVRWTQIRDHCLDALDSAPDAAAEEAAFRAVVGDRLRWGLSAAGWLDPQVFRFFQRHGVDLCSGFGMTEATGGITMTPPGAYRDGSVGIALPGIRTHLVAEGELEIAGVYVAAPLDTDGPPGSLPRPDPDQERWLATGDLFRESAAGYLEIVDRIKDIYKNSRGQTIAPQRVEKKFAGVPGFHRVFLAGDHRDHNVLLVVPDRDMPLLSGPPDQADEYFGQIVSSVNARLAPYERVVRYALIDRDFEMERGELTPKGSFRRKRIAENFAPTIESLYGASFVEIPLGALRVRIPRWFFRDLGVLEGDIVANGDAVLNRRTGLELAIAPRAREIVQVGDLEYAIPSGVIDLGLFARQPRLWVGNAQLAAFSPCKAGWDVSLRDVSDRVRIAGKARGGKHERATGAPLADDRLLEIHRCAVEALLGRPSAALAATGALGEVLARGGGRLSGATIRRRLEALAFRNEEEIRALAYEILVLDVPLIDYDMVFPAFIESGRSFLTEESIARIASARRGERRLQALRQRLHSYRTQLTWPGPPILRRQFRRVFRLLADFARHDPNDFAAVQAELASWALFREDPLLARAALSQHEELTEWHELQLAEVAAESEPIDGKIVFEFGIPAAERKRLEAILGDSTFLRHSLAHAFGEPGFSWDRVPPEGAWISPMLSHHQLRLYRIGLNLSGGRHFDLLLIAGEVMKRRAVKETILWMTALSGHALGTPALPRFGAWRQDLGAATVAYVSDLTAWERIRELASQRDVRDGSATRWALRKLYVRAMAGFFRAWDQSGGRIVPGSVTPSNVALPDADFHEAATILSIAGWRPYQGPLSLVRPMVRTFYRLAEAHYPQTREALDAGWIFDACIEALGAARAAAFIDELQAELSAGDVGQEDLARALLERCEALTTRPWLPLPVLCAIERFRDWARMNPDATQQAREEMAIQMAHLYRLDRFPDGVRFHLYRHTYFAPAGEEVGAAFERLIARQSSDPRALNSQLEELSSLQSLLTDPVDRAVFSRMVFPHARGAQKLELMELEGDEPARVIVRSEIADDSGSRYVVREPLTAMELGILYRLILETDYPMHIGDLDRQLVIADEEERIVGGLCYRWQEGGVASVDGIVVASALTNQGLGGRLLEDFCVRMAAEGARLVRTNFFLGGLFTKHGFQVNQRWGGLVRLLGAEADAR